MSIAGSFSNSYAEARAKFRAAAREAGGAISSFHNAAAAPAGAICESTGIAPVSGDEALSTDAAWIGPRTATRLVYAQSGTHGVEGFCGSGIQIGWLQHGLHRELPPDTALLLTHAINPHGFAWQRRVTEDNVDLNRNFVAHGAGYPDNAGYEALKHAICPREWSDAALGAADRILMDYAQEHGLMALQAAISTGQYGHAEGVYYGGRGETWSNRTLAELLRAHAGQVRQVAFIDLHTGLGPYGVGEIMNNHVASEPAFARVNAWFGSEATSTDDGSSSSVPVSGDITLGVQRGLPQAEVAGITLEYGTLPLRDMFDAIRADNWLHAHGDLRARQARDIKAQIRAAFYPAADNWKTMVFERSVDVLRRALAGLAQS
jgi:hypothetical protein